MIVPAVTVKLASVVVAPMAPLNVALPEVPAFKNTAAPPFTVLEKLMAAPAGKIPPSVLSNVMRLFARAAGPVIAMSPAVVVMFESIVIKLVLVAEKLASAVIPPMAPERVIAPDPADRVKPCDPAVVPLIVPPKKMAPLFAEVVTVLVPTKTSVVGTAFVMVKELAVILPETNPPIETEPVPAVDEIKIAPRGVDPPTAPVKEIVPLEPPLKVRACAPAVVALSVVEKVMFAPPGEFPPLVVSKVAVAVREAVPVIATLPAAVVMFPPMLIAVALELVVVAEKFPSAVLPPIAPERVIVLVAAEPAFKVSDCNPAAVPLITEEKVMAAPVLAPLLVLSKVAVLVARPVRETIPVSPMAPPCVTMFPPMPMAVRPAFVVVAEKAPSAVVDPTFPARVMVPVPDVRVNACEPAVVPLIVPPKEITPLFVSVEIVVLAASNVAGTAFVIVKEFAVMLLSIKTVPVPAADAINRAPSLVVVPTVLENVIVPVVPAFKVSAWDPAPVALTTLVKEMLFPAA